MKRVFFSEVNDEKGDHEEILNWISAGEIVLSGKGANAE